MFPRRRSTPPPTSLASGLRLADRLRQGAWWIAGLYLSFGTVWLFLATQISRNSAWPATITHIAAERAAFVVTSALLLLLALRWLSSRLVNEHSMTSESEHLLRQRFHSLPCPAWIYSPQSLQIVDVNPAALEFFGYSRDEFLGRSARTIWPEARLEHFEAILTAVRAHPEQGSMLMDQLQTRDGVRDVELRGNPLVLPDGIARLVVAIDRSTERQAQLRRDEALARLEEAQGIARLGSWELDPQTGRGFFSDEVYRILARQVPVHQRWHPFEELLTASDSVTQAKIDALVNDIGNAKAPVQVDVLLPLLASDGQPRMIHLRARSIDLPNGLRSVHGTFQDVTEREESRRLLREREEQFRELVRVMPDGVLIIDGEQVMYANPACAQQFGYSGEALLGEQLSSLVADTDLPGVRELLSGQGPRTDPGTARNMKRRDASRFYAGLSVGDVRYSGRDCKLLIVRDLSEPERIRDALAQSNRELQALAKRLFTVQEDERRAISRDLHDDIGQAITAMKLSAHAALDEDETERRNEDLGEIVQLADSTISKLRNLSMLLRPPQLDALGLEAALRWQANTLFRSADVRLEMDVHPLTSRPSGEIEQVCFRLAQESLTNVLRHANAGEVRLELRDDADGIHLSITDDGDGFEPAEAHGLGLIVMRERAQTVGGALRIDTAPGAGTHVEARLPHCANGADSPERQGDS